jgi:LPS sulfotransferase NodH
MKPYAHSVQFFKQSISGLRARLARIHADKTPVPTVLRPFAVIASQRSGTYLFRQVINSNPYATIALEPFTRHPRPAYWCNYVRTLPMDLFPPIVPEDAKTILDGYMQSILRDTTSERDPEWFGGPKPKLTALGLDIKYNQLRSVSPLAMELYKVPVLLEYFRDREFRVFHLVRKSLLHTAISLAIANRRDVWHNPDGEIIPGQYHIPWDELRNLLYWIQWQRDEFLRLAHELKLHTFYYEDLVDDLSIVDADGRFPADTKVLAPVAELLDIPNEFHTGLVMQRVINRPYAEIVPNLDELLDHVRNSEFAEFAPAMSSPIPA